KAGGTKDAYIVSFVDDWEDKIVWESPDSLISEEWLPNDKDYHTRNKMSWIAISLIENFARMADENVDTSEFEKIPSIKRIPLGMYIFETFQGTYSILVYDSNKEMYENLIKDLPNIFEDFGVDTEELPDDKLTEMIKYCRDYYFSNNTFPPFSEKDMGLLLEFYAEKEIEPTFIPLSEIERKSVHPADIAKHIIDEDMRRSEQNEYLQKMWDENQNLKIYYNQFMFFKKQVQIELDRCEGYIRTEDNSEYNPNVTYTNRELEKFTVQELKEIAPDYINPIIESVYAAAKNSDGEYVCAMCGQTFKARRYLQIDHIKPMSKGGLTVRDNLQILCRHCNGKKGDKE
ncbi:MAG: HNH endonuclease, partial [Oscillospiraceae bacterium]|nr:HNH endonuclease [Oscillospiraceae bacterium]